MPRTLALLLLLADPGEDPSAENARHVAELRTQIAGREQEPASAVFKNVTTRLKEVPAGRLLAIMDIGYSRSLGVACSHCHVPGRWDAEDKKPKQVARDMTAMAKVINEELLARIPNLGSEKPVVNCTTCHRGQVKPATDLR